MNPYVIPGFKHPSIVRQLDYATDELGPKPYSLQSLIERTSKFASKHMVEFEVKKWRKKDKQVNIKPTVDSLKGKRRFREYVIPRQMFCYAARILFESATLKQIGTFIGGRDHSTVSHAINTLDDLMWQDGAFKSLMRCYFRSVGIDTGS